MTHSATLKQAARYNPAWKPAKLYRIALEGGATVSDGAGVFQYDMIDDTFGMRDWQSEQEFTSVEPYDGDAAMLLITNETPGKFDLIHWNGDCYSPHEVLGGDGYGGTIKVRVKAIPETETITIRNNTV